MLTSWTNSRWMRAETDDIQMKVPPSRFFPRWNLAVVVGAAVHLGARDIALWFPIICLSLGLSNLWQWYQGRWPDDARWSRGDYIDSLTTMFLALMLCSTALAAVLGVSLPD